MPELNEYEVIARFALAIGGALLTCLLPDGKDSSDGEIRSIQSSCTCSLLTSDVSKCRVWLVEVPVTVQPV